jgi:hypothetical protein
VPLPSSGRHRVSPGPSGAVETLIPPGSENGEQARTQPPTQDGRLLRRYRGRWVVERTIRWLHNCRRVITRWEWYPELFEGFVH